MFTIDEFLAALQDDEFQALIVRLEVPLPDAAIEDEMLIYEYFDNEINIRVCDIMKSNSITEGYMTLLNFGKIEFDDDEDDDELLDKVIKNRNRILRGIENQAITSQQEDEEDDDEDEDEEDDDDEDEDEDEDDDDEDDDDEKPQLSPKETERRFFSHMAMLATGIVMLVFAVGIFVLNSNDEGESSTTSQFLAVAFTLGGIALIGFAAQTLVDIRLREKQQQQILNIKRKKVSVPEPDNSKVFMTVQEFNNMFKILELVQRIKKQVANLA